MAFRSRGRSEEMSLTPPPSDMASLLAQNIHMDGTLTGDGIVRLEGHFQGKIRHKGHLFIAETAVVKAKIDGADVTVMGQVIGDINTTGRLELKPTARVTGNIKAYRLVMAEGASLVGACDVVKKEDSPEPSIEADEEVSSDMAVN